MALFLPQSLFSSSLFTQSIIVFAIKLLLMSNIQKLAKLARKSISSYCMNECNAYCCRKGFLIMTEEELDLVAGSKREELSNNGFIKKQDADQFSLNFSNNLGGCPALNGSKCTIHTNSKRPSTCDNFPIFVNEDKKEVRLSPRCFAVKENKLYPFIHECKLLGFTINKL